MLSLSEIDTRRRHDSLNVAYSGKECDMKAGDKIKFSMKDDLFGDFIIGTGTLVARIYKSLWAIKPDKHERLSGIDIQLCENSFNSV